MTIFSFVTGVLVAVTIFGVWLTFAPPFTFIDMGFVFLVTTLFFVLSKYLNSIDGIV